MSTVCQRAYVTYVVVVITYGANNHLAECTMPYAHRRCHIVTPALRPLAIPHALSSVVVPDQDTAPRNLQEGGLVLMGTVRNHLWVFSQGALTRLWGKDIPAVQYITQ